MKTLEGFVRAGQRAQLAVDAIAITAQVKLVREHVDAAIAENAKLSSVSAVRPRVHAELEAALLELGSLTIAIAKHLERDAK